jgi:hypothetical protein
VTTAKGRKQIQHGGGINGFATEILRYPDQRVCVIVLCNVLPVDPAQVAHDLAAIAFGDTYEMPKVHTVAKVDPKAFDAYVGRYQVGPKVIATFTRDGDRFMIQLTGQPKFQVFPESDTDFFLTVVDATITFVKDDKGKVTHANIKQAGRDIKAKRLDDEPKGKAGIAK